ncbi:fip1 motif domain-containing protein [Ditylenchus destructor]|uniref:Fip1 motif domain-containing protein n=1 Tax=Ditylenchus destructor TaxID=166010 RepID=A0AAD4MW06_9BILA|nr:fip1 motif domain-containing protein [Ditylenchus destructor]
MLPSSREDDWYQNQPDPGTARKDTGARNPGIPGFWPHGNFLSRARIGPSDSSKCSPAQGKTIGTKISPIPARLAKIQYEESNIWMVSSFLAASSVKAVPASVLEAEAVQEAAQQEIPQQENHSENQGDHENGNIAEDQQNDDNVIPGNDEEDAELNFGDESDSEKDFVVTIGEIKETVPYSKKQQGQSGGQAGGGKIELDGAPTIKGTHIYDFDLATMEDKPWRKPGADITDYFNFGFNEDTWNQYCERQRKLRVEYGGNQEAVNRAIFSSISLPLQPQLTTMAGGRQLVSITGAEKPTSKVNKVVIDLSKPPPQMDNSNQGSGWPQVNIRTVLTGSNFNQAQVPSQSSVESADVTKPPPATFSSALISITPTPSSPTTNISNQPPNISANQIPTLGAQMNQPPPSLLNQPPPGANVSQPSSPILSTNPPVADFSRPPPTSAVPSASDFSRPPPVMSQPIQSNVAPVQHVPPIIPQIPRGDAPPGLDDTDLPPGASSPPPSLPTHLGALALNTAVPPPSSFGGFNPAVPPPGVNQTRIVPTMNMPPPSFNQYPPPGVNSGSAGFGASPFLRPMGGRSSNYPPGTEPPRGRMGGDYMREIKQEYDSGGESGDDSHRRSKRRRRSRSRSRSPLPSSSRRRDRDSSSSSSRSRRSGEGGDKKRSREDSEDKERKRKKHEKSDKDK